MTMMKYLLWIGLFPTSVPPEGRISCIISHIVIAKCHWMYWFGQKPFWYSDIKETLILAKMTDVLNLTALPRTHFPPHIHRCMPLHTLQAKIEKNKISGQCIKQLSSHSQILNPQDGMYKHINHWYYTYYQRKLHIGMKARWKSIKSWKGEGIFVQSNQSKMFLWPSAV